MKKRLVAVCVTASMISICNADISAAYSGDVRTISSEEQSLLDSEPGTYYAEWNTEKGTLTRPEPEKSFNSDGRSAPAEIKESAPAVVKQANSITDVQFTVDDKGKVEDRILRSNRGVTQPTEDSKFVWAASGDSAELSWWTPTSDITWTVKRNGEQIYRGKETHIRDASVDRSVRNRYTVTAEWDREGEKKDQSYLYGVDIPVNTFDFEGKPLQSESLRSVRANNDLVARFPGAPSEWSAAATGEITFGSFIQDKLVSGDLCRKEIWQDDYFSGDDRGFIQRSNFEKAGAYIRGERETPSFRGVSNVLFFMNDEDGINTPAIDHRVGETKHIVDGKIVERATASEKGLNVRSGMKHGRAVLEFTQDIRNPLCNTGDLTPAIDAKVITDIDPNGGLRVLGTHDGAPSYELLYILADMNGRHSGCGYRFENKGFGNLIAPVDRVVDLTWLPHGTWPVDCAIY